MPRVPPGSAGRSVFSFAEGTGVTSDRHIRPPPRRQFDVVGERIDLNSRTVLRWHASIAVARRDAAGNMKLDKAKSRRKIDGMATLVNAVGAAILHSPEPPSVYEQKGMLVLRGAAPCYSSLAMIGRSCRIPKLGGRRESQTESQTKHI